MINAGRVGGAEVGSGEDGVPGRDVAPEVTVVHLLRHGEVHNPAGVLYGRLPGYRLSELGRQMADKVAAVLAERDVTVVVASPLERAQETAAPIAAALGVDVITDERLIEAGNSFQGLTFGVGDGSLRRPGHWRRLHNPFRPSWGEPYRDQARRMLAAMSHARRLAHGHEAVCVSHQLPIWTARRAVEGRPLWHDPRRRECSLASLTTFTYEGSYAGDREAASASTNDDGEIVAVSYTEPAGELLPGASKVPGA